MGQVGLGPARATTLPAGRGAGGTTEGSAPLINSIRAMLIRLGTMVANCDEETADYLAASAVRTLWDKAYELDRLENGPDAVAEAERIAELRADLSGGSVPDNAFAETSGSASPPSTSVG